MEKQETEKPFGQVLTSLREERGLSKSHVARVARISLGNLWKYEHGKTEPQRDMVVRLAVGLGMHVADLEAALVASKVAS